MEKLKDINLIGAIIVFVLFSVFYFMEVNKLSYAFEDNLDTVEMEKIKIDVIEKCSLKYGEDNKDSISEDNLYIKVSDLIDGGYIVPNFYEDIININNNKSLKEGVIKISNKDSKIEVEVSI